MSMQLLWASPLTQTPIVTYILATHTVPVLKLLHGQDFGQVRLIPGYAKNKSAIQGRSALAADDMS